MRALILSTLLIVILFTTNLARADILPPSTSLGVEVLETEYSYKADDGTTVVLGEVRNNLNSPINNVVVGVSFQDDNNNVIEYKTGTTLLQVIQTGGKSPFSISSTKADPSITQVQVKLAGFRSSPDKQPVLEISPDTLKVSDKLLLSGTIKNSGAEKSTNTKLYLISYDPFPRVVGIGTSNPIDIDAGQDSKFSITSTLNSRAKSYMIVAESDNYQSKPTDIQNVQVTLPVVMGSTIVTDPQGNKYSTIPVNSPVKITSNLKYLLQLPQPFLYYVQVKQFDGRVEFVGKNDTGIFLGGDQSVSVSWIPHYSGSYYIETYVWSSDSVPLSVAGTKISVVLVKS